jgi:hypothetical protein
LGWLPFREAQFLWLILSLVLLFGSADFLWRHYGGQPRLRLVAWACVALFFPDPVALRMGQLAPFIFFGLACFLAAMRAQRPLLAGVCLFAAGIKPHLLIPVVLAAVLWAFHERRWSVLAGLGAGTFIATAIAVITNPGVLKGYEAIWTRHPPVEFVSGVGGILRLVFGFELVWLQFLPAVFGMSWALWRWRRYRAAWHWDDQLPVLLLVALISTPYGWAFDQPVLMVAVLHAATAVAGKPAQFRIAAVFIAGNLIMAVMSFAGFTDAWFLWSSPLWAGLYFAATRPVLTPDRDVTCDATV